MAKKKKKTTAKAETKAVPSPRRQVDYEALKPVSQAARLVDVQTIRFSGQANKYLHHASAAGFSQRLRYRAIRATSTPDSVAVFVDFEHEALEGDEIVAFASGQIVVVYELKSANVAEFASDTLDAFAWVNGLYNSWSYLRELVSASMSRIGLHGVVIPVWHAPTAIPTDMNDYLTMFKSSESARPAPLPG